MGTLHSLQLVCLLFFFHQLFTNLLPAMAYSWKDKVVLNTGAATGIGAVVVRLLMDEGVKHVAVLDINEKAGLELQKELNSKYGDNKVKFYKVDVTNDDQLLGAFDAVVKDQGHLDVVINNAGIMNDGLDSYRKEIQINVTAPVTGTLKALEIMGKDKGGRGGTVINISSIAALRQGPLQPIYSGTKSFVLQFSNCVGLEDYYTMTGVRVLTICFGTTDTPILHVNNFRNFNEKIQNLFPDILKGLPLQKPENAAKGLIDMFKQAESGSTWISIKDRPVKNITETIKNAYDLMAQHVLE